MTSIQLDSGASPSGGGGGGGNVATDPIWTAKGQVAAATGASAAVAVAPGINGLILTTESGQTAGLSYTLRSSITSAAVKPITGRYYVGHDQSLAAGKAVTSPETVFIPITFPIDVTADRISLFVSTAVALSTVRLGIYSSRTDGLPGLLLLDAGTIDSSSTGLKEIVISQVLKGGYTYWLALNGSTSGIAAWGPGGTNVSYDLGRTSGALDANTHRLYYSGSTAGNLTADLTAASFTATGNNSYAQPVLRVA